MKRLHYLIGLCLILLTGCSQMDLLDKKAPSKNNPKEAHYVQDEQQTNKQGNENGLRLEAVYFNKIQDVAGKRVIQNPLNLLALVNKQFALPDGYVPNDLTRPNVDFSFGNKDIEKSYMRKKAAVALEKMFKDAKKTVLSYRLFRGTVHMIGKLHYLMLRWIGLEKIRLSKQSLFLGIVSIKQA